MARPVKRRRVCGLPPVGAFRPEGGPGGPVLEVTVDEYEAVRLIDLLGLTQEECAAQMNVARTTVQAIYDSAREKLARMLAEGRPLAVQGGTYDLCGQAEHCCGRRCRRRGGGGGRCENGRLTCREEGRCPGRSGVEQNRMKQEGPNMKIAVTYENGQVFQHFGHTERFKIYEVEDGAVTASQVVDTAGSGHGALAGFLRERGVQTLICGGIGGGARTALAQAEIQLYPGVSGAADQAVADLLAGRLAYDPDTVCSHHHEGDGAHQCGGHGEGEGHSCGPSHGAGGQGCAGHQG